MRTHVDLFSGIGGFALACAANDVRTIQFVEIDARCRAFLEKAWPGVPIHDDIRTFRWNGGMVYTVSSSFRSRRNEDEIGRNAIATGTIVERDCGGMADNMRDRLERWPMGKFRGVEGQEQEEAGGESEAWRSPSFASDSFDGGAGGMADGSCESFPSETGECLKHISDNRGILRPERISDRPVWLLTGGVPCQPASRAGRQLGAADDRWLWPEAIRCLAEIRPAWALFENPPGIGDVGLAGILAEVEAQGYEVQVVSIPACAVGAPHRRERYWIVGRLANSAEKRAFARTTADRAIQTGEFQPGILQGERSRNGHNSWNADSCCVAHECGPGHQESKWPGTFRKPRTTSHGATAECADGGMADSEAGIERPGLCEAEQGWQRRGRSGDGDCGFWADYTWLPCADGKVRRAPDDSIGLVDGLHRSVLAALGNSIVWQVAAEIVAAMIKAES